MTPAQRWLRRTYPEALGPLYTEVKVVDADGVERIQRRPYRLPLKLGVVHEILADPRRPAFISKRAIRKALAQWTGHDLYLMALSRKKRRIALDGAKLERVSPEHAAAAEAILKMRRAGRRAAQWGEPELERV